MDKRKTRILAALAATSLAIAGCSAEVENAPDAVEQTNDTLASALSAHGDLGIVAGAVSDSGLASVFDGPGAYTVLAPSDAAFGTLGEQANTLMQDDQRAVLVALLRDHILPGQLDIDSVRAAIESKGGPVEMTTLGDGTLSFALDGDTLTVTGGGSSGTLDASKAVIASNGVVLPVDTVLKGLPETAQ